MFVLRFFTVMSTAMLKQYVRLMLETIDEYHRAPFELTGAVAKAKPNEGNFTIYRDFPLVVTPELSAAMGVTANELTGGNILEGEHEIVIDVETHYQTSTFKGNREQPPDPDEFSVEGWSIVSINGLIIDPVDAKKLYDYLGGELTQDEIDSLEQDARENYDGLDQDDYYNRDY